MSRITNLSMVLIAASLVAVAAWAQMSPGPGDLGPGRGGFPGFGQGDDLADVQAALRASNEEWKVIGPKLRSLMAARASVEASIDASMLTNTAVQSGMGAMGRGPFGGGPGGFGRDSFEAPGLGGPMGGGPGPGGFGRGRFGRGGSDPNGPGPQGFGPGPQGFGPGPQGFGPGGPDPNGPGPGRFGGPGFGPGGQGGFGRGGRGGGFGGPMMFGPFGGGKVMESLMELRTVVTDPNATSEQIKEKAGAVRAAREKAKLELAASQKDLLQLLTPDQEAVLVILGHLD